MTSDARSVDDYLKSLPPDRRAAINTVRKVILANLQPGFAETMSYGMIGYAVPHSLYPAGYHCDPSQPLPYINLGSQKNHMALHLISVYGNPALEEWFRKAWTDSGKKLDLGKACLRFKKVEDLSLEVLGALVARVTVDAHIARFEELASRRKTKR